MFHRSQRVCRWQQVSSAISRFQPRLLLSTLSVVFGVLLAEHFFNIAKCHRFTDDIMKKA